MPFLFTKIESFIYMKEYKSLEIEKYENPIKRIYKYLIMIMKSENIEIEDFERAEIDLAAIYIPTAKVK